MSKTKVVKTYMPDKDIKKLDSLAADICDMVVDHRYYKDLAPEHRTGFSFQVMYSAAMLYASYIIQNNPTIKKELVALFNSGQSATEKRYKFEKVSYKDVNSGPFPTKRKTK